MLKGIRNISSMDFMLKETQNDIIKKDRIQLF